MNDFPNNKTLFKLVLGAGNECVKNVDEVVTVYAQSSVDIFDFAPNEEVINTVYDSIIKTGHKIDDFSYCASFVCDGDIHSQKAFIDEKKCNKCMKCIQTCLQGAINCNNEKIVIDKKKCIGCEKCRCDAITFMSYANSENLIDSLDMLKKYKIDIVELHISTFNKDEIISKWKKIINNFDGLVSICTDRSWFSDRELEKLLIQMIEMTEKKRVIIQADGNPMTGGENTYVSTLQAIASADLVKNLGATVFISGGTNSKTPELAKLCEINYSGITVGSYARKIIKNQKSQKDAVKIAKKFVNDIKQNGVF